MASRVEVIFEMWAGDTLHGPVIGGKKSYLFAFTGDHSRAVMGARWAHHDDVVRMAAAFRPALQARGVPKSAYLDNGSAFVDAWLLRGCAVLGIRLIHSRPGRPLLTGQYLTVLRGVWDDHLRKSQLASVSACRLDQGRSDLVTGVPCLMRNA